MSSQTQTATKTTRIDADNDKFLMRLFLGEPVPIMIVSGGVVLLILIFYAIYKMYSK